MLLCVAMLFCSCGKEERAVLGYEQPVATLVTAAQYSDTQSYLSCFTPEAEAEYKNSDSYNEALAETLLTRGEEKTELSYKLSNKKELDSDGLKNLEKSYKVLAFMLKWGKICVITKDLMCITANRQ